MEPFKVKLAKLLGGVTKCCNKEVGYSLSCGLSYTIIDTVPQQCKICSKHILPANVNRYLKNEKPIFHLMCNINSYLIQHDFYALLSVDDYIEVNSLLEDIQHNIQKLHSSAVLRGYKQRLNNLKEKNWQCFELFNLIELSLEYQYEDNIQAFFTKLSGRERFNFIIADVIFPEAFSTKKLLKKPPTSVEDVNNLVSVLYNKVPGDFLSTEVMGILADAVEEYIPDIPTEVLSHLRDIKMPHYRGCWAVEYLMGSFNNV